MNYKNTLIFLCCFICFFSIAGVCASDVNDNGIAGEDTLQLEFPVTNDIGILGETDDGTFAALQKKIDDAENATTIVLENNYTYNDGFNKDGITVSKALTIDGNGYAINGLIQSRIFNVLNDGVLFKNIVFFNAYTEGNGAAVCGNCIVTDCTFTNNYANGDGGALSYATAVGCSFESNHADGKGGAIFNGDATSCSFNSNNANLGGAIYTENAQQAIKDCSFNSNSAYQGGAIYSLNSQASVTNCYFNDNKARQGGAVFNVTARNCIFENNGAVKYDGDDNGDGGAMRSGTAINCTFTGNYADDDGDGGALSHAYAENCSFVNNNADDEGGAIYYSNAVNCNLTGNHANDEGGAIYWGDAQNCIFTNNRAGDDDDDEEGGAIYNGNAKNCTFIGNFAYHGGAMYGNEDDGTFTADGCTFTGNTADGGGAIYRIDAVNCIFTNNTSTDDGGAMYYGTANDCTFITNHADSEGGAFYKATTYNCVFSGNTPKVDTFKGLQDLIDDADDTLHLDYDYYFDEEIDGDYVEGIEIDDDLTIDGNYRTIDARHMARIFKITDESSVTINNLVLINGNYNTLDWLDYEDGGGAIIIFEDSSLTINNVDFFNNTCDHYGGAIKLVEGSLYVNGGKFINNTVYQDNAFGGAIACYGDCPSITINNASFIHNSANMYGGAILLAFGDIKIIGGEFVNNSADSGGAIRGWNTMTDDGLTSFSITGGTKFINNLAWDTLGSFDGGGAIDVDGAYLCEIEDVEFINNSAGNFGGAINGVAASRLHLTGVKFINNSAPNGGAVTFACQDSYVKDCIFINNSADKGSALLLDSKVNLENNTINTEFPEIYVNYKGYISSPVNIRVMDNATYELFNPVQLNATLLTDDKGNLIIDEGLYFIVGADHVPAHYDEEKMIFVTDYITLDEGGEYVISANSDKYYQIIPQTAFIKIKEVLNGSFTDLAIRIFYAQLGNNSLELPYNFSYIKEFDDKALKNGFLINNPFFIEGNGHTISGSGLASMFHFCNNATLKNINFVNAYSADKMGGAVYSENSSAYALINNCNFTNNSVLSSGGAIYANSDLIILNSNFDNNSANAGGSIYASDHVHAINCKFNDNECPVNGTIFLSFNKYSSQIELSEFTYSQGDGKYAIVNIGNVELHLNNISGSVFNEGNLRLHENKIDGTVYNYGKISNKTLNAVIIDGETVNVKFMETVYPYATLVNHDGNAIFEPGFKITLNDESLKTGYDNKLRRYVAEYTFDIVCERIAGTNYPVDTVFNGKYVVLANLSMFNITVDEPSKRIVVGNNVTISVFMYDDKGRKLSVEDLPVVVNNNKYHLKIVNGTNSFNVSGLAPGNYSAIGIYEVGDYNAYATDVFTVFDPDSKRNTTITSDVTVDNHNVTITVTVDKEATGFIKFSINDKEHYYPVINGQAVLVSDFPAGNYKGNAQYQGDENFNGNSSSFSFKVTDAAKSNTTITSDVSIIEDKVIFTVSVDKDATGYVVVNVDGTGYYAEIKDGQAIIDIKGLEAGKNYTATVVYSGDDKYASANATKTIVVPKVVPDETIISKDLTKIEKAPDRFIAKFTDNEGNPLNNTKVTFAINGLIYTRTTDSEGEASLAINLIKGNYTITITNPVTGEVKTNHIDVLSRFSEDGDLVKYFRNDSQYVLRVLDDAGNHVKAGEVVTFNINGVFYNRTINATGHVKLNIKLNPGEYIITSEYKGCRVAHKVTVLPILTGKDLTKKYGQIDAYEATLVDGQGKAYANQIVVFNINGVFYYRITDSKGIAKLNMNLQPGKYIITAFYDQAITANTITVTA